MDDNNQIIIYQSEDGETRIEVKFTGETVWLSQQQMAELYQSSRSNVVEHIKHIYEDGELDEESTCRNFRQVRQEGNRQVTREIPFYNLDMIISLGYRIRSVIATHFRRWATERLKEYIIKGFTMDDERLKGNGGGAYWRELLDRIRDIRSSEKVMYRQVLDLYATAVDSTGEALLNGPGSVSHQQAMDKAREEYHKFQVRELSPVERAYLDTVKAINAEAKNKGNSKD